MPRTHSNFEKIRAELSWVAETPYPNKCGCRNLRCRGQLLASCCDEILDVPMGVIEGGWLPGAGTHRERRG